MDHRCAERGKFNFFEWLEGLFGGKEKTVDTNSLGWVQSVGRMLAFIFEVLLWSVPIIIVVYLVLYFKDKNYYFKFHQNRKELTSPVSLFGMDMREESLPDNVLGQVIKLWRSKEHRQALSLLYRASLVRLMHGHKIEFEQSDTEVECLQKVRSVVERDVATYFMRLTGAWINLAYGHHRPSAEVFDKLCRNWAQFFEDNSTNVHA